MKQILFFTQTGCKPCLELKPFVEQTAAKYNVSIDFIDIRTEGGKKSATNFGIFATPEVFIIEDGKIKAHYKTPTETRAKLQAALSGEIPNKNKIETAQVKDLGLVAGATVLGYYMGKRNGAIFGAIGGMALNYFGFWGLFGEKPK